MACAAHGPPHVMLLWLNSVSTTSNTSRSSCSWLIASAKLTDGRQATQILANTCGIKKKILPCKMGSEWRKKNCLVLLSLFCKLLFIGFLQLSQDQIPVVFKEFSRSQLLFSMSPILGRSRLHGI